MKMTPMARRYATLSLVGLCDVIDAYMPCRHRAATYTMPVIFAPDCLYLLHCERCGVTVSEVDLEHAYQSIKEDDDADPTD